MAATLTLTGPTRRTPHAIVHHRSRHHRKVLCGKRSGRRRQSHRPRLRDGHSLRHDTGSATGPARCNAELIDQVLPPGHARWIVVDYGPHAETPVHHTDTLDLETIISGSVDLILDDGAHHLEVGDMVVMTGVDHAWRAGPDGCRINAVLIGTPPL